MEGIKDNTGSLTTKLAMNVLTKVKTSIAQRSSSNDQSSTSISALGPPIVKPKNYIASDAVLEERYDRMSRKDFSRKTNAFAPALINDGYANFRFSKRAGEVLSPLNKTKFGLTTRTSMRKMSLGPNQ